MMAAAMADGDLLLYASRLEHGHKYDANGGGGDRRDDNKDISAGGEAAGKY